MMSVNQSVVCRDSPENSLCFNVSLFPCSSVPLVLSLFGFLFLCFGCCCMAFYGGGRRGDGIAAEKMNTHPSRVNSEFGKS